MFATLILYALSGWILSVFGATGEAIVLVSLFCSWFAITQFFNAALFISNAAFNNLGRPVYATISNWGQHTLGTIPFVLLGASWFGAPGVLYGQAFGGLIFAALACGVAYWLVQRLSDQAVDVEEIHRAHTHWMPLHAHTRAL